MVVAGSLASRLDSGVRRNDDLESMVEMVVAGSLASNLDSGVRRNDD